jgi:hypothetical protein
MNNRSRSPKTLWASGIAGGGHFYRTNTLKCSCGCAETTGLGAKSTYAAVIRQIKFLPDPQTYTAWLEEFALVDEEDLVE